MPSLSKQVTENESPGTPRAGDKILCGLSLGQKYHDNLETLSRQFEDLQQFKPSVIKPFLSDVAHVYTDLLPELLDSASEKDWSDNLQNLLHRSVLDLYYRGKAWRTQMSSLFNNKKEYWGEYSSEVSFESDSPATSVEDCKSSDDDESTEINRRERSYSADFGTLQDVDNWLDFDEDVRLMLKQAAIADNKRVVYSKNISTKLDFTKIIESNETEYKESEIDYTPLDSDILLPSITDQMSIKMNAYFKSIYLNMLVYYINGRLLLIKKDFLKPSDEVTKFYLNRSELESNLNNELTKVNFELVEHNKFLNKNGFRDPFALSHYTNTGKSTKLAMSIATDLLSDAENYLVGHFKDKFLVTRYCNSYKSMLSIKYSAEYMIKNFAAIGIYSIFHQFDVYHYPRRTTKALITFTNKFLAPVIKTLVNKRNASLKFDPMDERIKGLNSLPILPYITTPFQIKEEFLLEVSSTIKTIREEWEKGGSPADMRKSLNQFNNEELNQLSDVLMYWIDFSMNDFKKLSRRTIRYLKEEDRHEVYDPEFEEALKNAKIVMKMLISCMRYSLPNDDLRFSKMASLYGLAFSHFTCVLEKLHCDFSTDDLIVVIDEEVLSRMKIFLNKIEEKKLSLQTSYNRLGNDFKEVQIKELDQKIYTTTFLIKQLKRDDEPDANLVSADLNLQNATIFSKVDKANLVPSSDEEDRDRDLDSKESFASSPTTLFGQSSNNPLDKNHNQILAT